VGIIPLSEEDKFFEDGYEFDIQYPTFELLLVASLNLFGRIQSQCIWQVIAERSWQSSWSGQLDVWPGIYITLLERTSFL
jgi:hypothetical protein